MSSDKSEEKLPAPVVVVEVNTFKNYVATLRLALYP